MALRWLTLPQAAARLGISVRTLQRRIARGKVTSRRGLDGRRDVAIEVSDDLSDSVPDGFGPISPQERAAWVALKQADHIAETYDRQLSATRGEVLAARRVSRLAWALAGTCLVVVGLVVAWAVRTSNLPPAAAGPSDIVTDAPTELEAVEQAAVSDTVADNDRLILPYGGSATSAPYGDSEWLSGESEISFVPDILLDIEAEYNNGGHTGLSDGLTDWPGGPALPRGDTVARRSSQPAPSADLPRPGVLSDRLSDKHDSGRRRLSSTKQKPPASSRAAKAQAVAAGAKPRRLFLLASQRHVHALSLTVDQQKRIGVIDKRFNALYQDRMAAGSQEVKAGQKAMRKARDSGNTSELRAAQAALSNALLGRQETRKRLDDEYCDAVRPILTLDQEVELQRVRQGQ